MKKYNRLKRIWDAFTTIIVALVVILAILLVGARFFGVKPFCVISGSMRPEYPVGSLIYVKEVDPSTINPRDVITYKLPNGTPSTHRVLYVDEVNKLFYTKGDANDTKDKPVEFDALIGIPVFKIPIVGFFAFYIQNPPGSYIAIAVVAILLLISFVPDLFKEEDKSEKGSIPDNKGKVNR